MSARYKVIYNGQLSDVIEKNRVVKNLSELFNVPREKAENLILSQKPRIIKRDLSQDKAEKYKSKLADAGLIANIEVDDTNSTKPSKNKVDITPQTILPKPISKEKPIANENLAQSIYKSPNSKLKEEITEKMGFIGLLGRFTMWYFIIMVIIGIALNLLGLRGNSGSGFAIVFVSVMLACTSFAKKNERYLTKNERIKATLAFSFINAFFQFLFSALMLIGLSKPLTPQILLIVVAVPLLVHTPFIYFIIGSNKKRMIKRGEIDD